jgi:hypothetical protein
MSRLVLAFSMLVVTQTWAQQTKYDLYELRADDLFWRNIYYHQGNRDSIRVAVVQLLKSKFFTFNVVRNEAGYSGEIRHYKIDYQKYGRNYLNTPRMYTEGEWTGKFMIEVSDGYYQVTIYALHVQAPERATGYYKTEKTVRSRYIDVVTKRSRSTLKRNELNNMSLLSLDLKFNFSLENFVAVN